jgi:hypothetical protein
MISLQGVELSFSGAPFCCIASIAMAWRWVVRLCGIIGRFVI